MHTYKSDYKLQISIESSINFCKVRRKISIKSQCNRKIF